MPPDLRTFRKLNFGAGYDKRPGYLNVDVDPACRPDLLIVDGDYSGIPRNHFEEIVAMDVLEHIGRAKTLSVLLDWSEFLQDQGRLVLETSSILGVAQQLETSSKFEDQYAWTLCLFGSQVHAGDFHLTGFTEATLRTYLLAAGYGIDRFEVVDKWLFSVDAHKTFNWADVVEDNRRKDNVTYTRSLFQTALGRDPDDLGGQYIIQGLNAGTMSRRYAARHLFESYERLLVTAKRHGL